MKTENYTNQPLSKLLNEKMEYESEIWWEIEDGEEYERHGKKRRRVSFYPKLTFTDLLHWLKLYGEKTTWKYIDYDEHKRVIYEQQHTLLDAYIADKLTIGTNVEKFIREIIK